MHRCLLVAEIFSHIAYFLTANTRGGLGGKQEVDRLALTCKAFCGPALDAVWREIFGLVNLIYLLPADLWHGPKGPQSTSCMTRQTVATDWTRFLLHASRVREFTFTPPSDNRPSRAPPWNIDVFNESTVICHLQQQCPEPYMLPGITKLFWNGAVEHIHIFTPPSLRDLDLYCSTAHPGVLELLAAEARIVTSLFLTDPYDDSADALAKVDAISLAIIRMERLVALRCYFSRLSIPFRSLDDPSFFSATSSTCFQSLTHFVACPSHPTLLSSLFHAASSPFIENVWWEVSDNNPDNILEVVTSLVNGRSKDALKSVTVSAPWDLEPDDHAVTLSTFKPLLSLTGLTDLCVSIPWLDLGNDDLEQIAVHLRLLTTLTLSPPGLFGFSRITPRGLLPLFRHCALEHLRIVINVGEDIPEAGRRIRSAPEALTQNGVYLRFLNLGNSRIGSAKVEPAAIFLSELVPCLTSLTAWKHDAADLIADRSQSVNENI
ncbi:hypothetical protein C8R47DRAFT_1209880 [Mycena vitilis]|nr:hypothetical protein C8R47DRAFT_1209880 [Mycena vitilis]